MDLRTFKTFIRYPKAYLSFRKRGGKIWLGRNGIIGNPSQIIFEINKPLFHFFSIDFEFYFLKKIHLYHIIFYSCDKCL